MMPFFRLGSAPTPPDPLSVLLLGFYVVLCLTIVAGSLWNLWKGPE
jgi:hypothetical protein